MPVDERADTYDEVTVNFANAPRKNKICSKINI